MTVQPYDSGAANGATPTLKVAPQCPLRTVKAPLAGAQYYDTTAGTVDADLAINAGALAITHAHY